VSLRNTILSIERINKKLLKEINAAGLKLIENYRKVFFIVSRKQKAIPALFCSLKETIASVPF